MILIVGNLYKIIKVQYLYINKYYSLTNDYIYPVLNFEEYVGKIFLYLGVLKHPDAENGYFYKFLYDNEIYLTEGNENFAPVFEKIEVS